MIGNGAALPMADGTGYRVPGASPVGRGVIGILSRGGAYLMVRRAAGVAKGGYWCFPGGHVERGETPRQAIRREIEEELGLEVTPTKRLGSIRVIDKRRYILVAWRVRQTGGVLEPALNEIAEARWLTPQDIHAVCPSLPSNLRVLEMLGA